MSKKLSLSLSLALAAVLMASCASSGPSLSASGAPPLAMKSGMLVDAKGMTVYTFDRDSAGKSVCNGDCAVKWPPVMARADDKPSGDYTIVTRDDGKRQWAVRGKPLYTWPEDQDPGDKYGDNYNKVWHIVR